MASNEMEKGMENSNSSKMTPKDALVMASILKEMGVYEYEPRVINQMLEFSYRKFIHSIFFVKNNKKVSQSSQARRSPGGGQVE